MSATSLVCPHCSVRQAGHAWVDEGLAEQGHRSLHVSADEARAIIELGGRQVDTRSRGPEALFLPCAESSGWGRVIEWGLTVLAAPLLLAGFIFLVLRRRIWRDLVQDADELLLTFAFGFFGATGMAAYMFYARWEIGTTLGCVGVCLGALFLRLWLRRRAAS